MKTRWEQDKRLCTCFATGLASLYHCISSCISYTRRPRRGERALFRYNTFTAVYQSSTAGREVDDWFNESRQLVFVSRCTTGDRWILRFRYRQNIRMLAPPPPPPTTTGRYPLAFSASHIDFYFLVFWGFFPECLKRTQFHWKPSSFEETWIFYGREMTGYFLKSSSFFGQNDCFWRVGHMSPPGDEP